MRVVDFTVPLSALSVASITSSAGAHFEPRVAMERVLTNWTVVSADEDRETDEANVVHDRRSKLAS
jgi:hypothetical protein